MPRKRPTVLSLAGFDPSAGAGVLADVKTFEAHKVYGLAVPTALTWQNESKFEAVEWINAEKIISQAELLLKKSEVSYVKIGLVENATTLATLIDFLTQKISEPKIIWDPILKASAGFDFHSQSQLETWTSVLPQLFLTTPNWQEAAWLSNGLEGTGAAHHLASHCHIYLKGGHRPDKIGYDSLILHSTSSEKQELVSFKPPTSNASPKHGSGCIFSSALTALMAKGYPLRRACLMAKQYTTKVLESNPGLLGWHKI